MTHGRTDDGSVVKTKHNLTVETKQKQFLHQRSGRIHEHRKMDRIQNPPPRPLNKIKKSKAGLNLGDRGAASDAVLAYVTSALGDAGPAGVLRLSSDWIKKKQPPAFEACGAT